MKENTQIEITGNVQCILTDSDGNVKQQWNQNLIVSTGTAWIVQKLLNNSSLNMNYMAIGSGTTVPVIGNTALQSELARVACSSVTGTNNVLTFNAFFGQGIGTGTIGEAGIFSAASSGTMLNKVQVSPTVVKNSGDSLTIIWTLTFN
jgi:hypothetical protein